MAGADARAGDREDRENNEQSCGRVQRETHPGRRDHGGDHHREQRGAPRLLGPWGTTERKITLSARLVRRCLRALVRGHTTNSRFPWKIP